MKRYVCVITKKRTEEEFKLENLTVDAMFTVNITLDESMEVEKTRDYDSLVISVFDETGDEINFIKTDDVDKVPYEIMELIDKWVDDNCSEFEYTREVDYEQEYYD